MRTDTQKTTFLRRGPFKQMQHHTQDYSSSLVKQRQLAVGAKWHFGREID